MRRTVRMAALGGLLVAALTLPAIAQAAERDPGDEDAPASSVPDDGGAPWFEPDPDKDPYADVQTPYGPSVSLARERQLLEYQALLTPEQSPGLYYPDPAGGPAIRVFADVGIDELAADLSEKYPEVRLVGSRYTLAEFRHIDDAVLTIPLGPDEGFVAGYEADADIYEISGALNTAVLEQVARGVPYEYVPGGPPVRAWQLGDPAMIFASPLAAAAAAEPEQDKDAELRELLAERDNADPLADAAWLAYEERRRRLIEGPITEVSPGAYFENDGVPVIRIYAGLAGRIALEAVISDWPAVRVLPSRYSASELAAMRELVRAIPLAAREAFGAAYDAEQDIFSIAGPVDPEAVARTLDGYAYEFVQAEGGRRPLVRGNEGSWGTRIDPGAFSGAAR